MLKPCPEGTIVHIAMGNDDFFTLVAAVTVAGLVDALSDALSGNDTFPVFAPTNKAFSALPEGVLKNLLLAENNETLQDILLYHVVEGFVLSTDLVSSNVET
jgi:uncharacterized surface protein with fasciclin (FAS1) repeats